MAASTLGMSATLTPTKHYGSAQKKSKAMRVRHFGIPGLGRVAFTRDEGEAELFSDHFLKTNLHVTKRDNYGQVVLDENLGSGLVSNVGVLALASDFLVKQGKAKEAFNLFALAKYAAWGTKATAATKGDIKLGTFAETSEGALKATAGVNTLGTTSGKGEPKLLSTATLKAAGTLKVVEWGLFTNATIEATTGTPLVSVTGTSGKVTATPLTASSEEVIGERFKILEAAKNASAEAKPVWGLITSNTTSEVTVPAWYQQSLETVVNPEGTSAFVIRPVMWDHKEFGSIECEAGNEISFKYELQITSGG